MLNQRLVPGSWELVEKQKYFGRSLFRWHTSLALKKLGNVSVTVADLPCTEN